MTRSPRTENQTKHSDGDTVIYVYGIVPSDVEVKQGAEGIGDPLAKVEVIREGNIAALVSAIPADQPIGKPDDLQAHANLLDGTSAVAPVLPLRFGEGTLRRENHPAGRAFGKQKGTRPARRHPQ